MWQSMLREEDFYSNVEYVKKLYEEQQEKVKKAQYIEGVLLEDYVENVRSVPNLYDHISEFFEKAQKEIGNKKKADRKNLEFITEKISDDFFNGNKIKIKEILCNGFEGYGWSIKFDFCDTELELVIPIRKRIKKENFNYAHYGKFVLFIKENSVCWNALCSSYKTEDIAKFLSDFKQLKEKENGRN